MHPIFADYLLLLEEGERRERTLTNNRQAFERFEAWSKRKRLNVATVTQADMREFANHLKASGSVKGGPLAASTVQRHLIHIRAAYAYAKEMGQVAVNPTAGLSKLLPRVADTEPEILSPKDMRAVLAEIKTERERVAFYTVSLTGLRRHELLALRWEPTKTQPSFIDFDNRQVVVLGKGGKHRLIPMHDILYD